MSLKTLIILILAVVIFYYYRIAKAAKSLEFKPGRVANFSLKGGVSWTQTINIVNNETVSIPITSASISPYVGLVQVGIVKLKSMTIIRGNSITPIQFDVTIPYSDLIMLGLEAAELLKSGKLDFKLVGSVKSVGINVPVSESFNVNISNL